MADREKVIRVLSHFPTNTFCAEGGEVTVADVLALLKAQEPVYAIVVLNGIDNTGGWWFQCPSCKMEIETRDKYCRSCGQAVKWE